ncbi:MAG: hypothetical protein Q7T83_01705 [Thermodesulfovibrionales bacterium]|nr:hypothetical protein [Thermodesulfovibrionales bacterium]
MITSAIQISETLNVLLKETGEECGRTLRLLSQIEIEDLTHEQLAGILTELAVSFVHLHAHTGGLQELINDEIERL